MPLVAKQALVCWFSALALIIAALFAFVGAPGSPYGAVEAIGRVFAHTGIAALICWVLARRKTPPWSWVRFALLYLALVVVLAVVANAGRAHAADAMLSDSTSAGQRGPATVAAFAADRASRDFSAVTTSLSCVMSPVVRLTSNAPCNVPNTMRAVLAAGVCNANSPRRARRARESAREPSLMFLKKAATRARGFARQRHRQRPAPHIGHAIRRLRKLQIRFAVKDE
jgi:hypothetical protein